MSDRTPKERRIETSISIEAPVDAVWKALTDGRELANWFPPYAEVKPGVGGHIRVVWGEKQDWTSPIGAWEPDRHLQVVWCEATPKEQAEQARKDGFFVPFRIAVDYYLEGKGGKTVLRLVHSGFSSDASWDTQYDGTRSGWASELRGLKHYLEHHRGTRRVVVQAKHDISGLPPGEAWRRVLGPEALNAEESLAGRSAGDRYSLRTALGDRLEGEIRIIAPPKDFCGTVETLGDAFFRVRIGEACMTAPKAEAHLWLSTYGLPTKQTDALQKRWQAMLDRLFATVRS